MPKRISHMQLGLEREISDEEEEFEEDLGVEYEYMTEEVEEVDEVEQPQAQMTEGQEEEEESPFTFTPGINHQSTILEGIPRNRFGALPQPNINGGRKYDQLSQEDDILRGR